MKKLNNIYLYDDTFISLLTLVKTLIKNKIIPLNIKNNNYNPNLFDNVIDLKLTIDDNIILEMKKIFGLHIFKTLYYLYLSNNNNKELLIYYFVLYSIKFKNSIFYQLNIPVISDALKTVKYVGNEAHKLKGFLRFKELTNNILYAEIAPENNVIILISQHFKERLKNEYWIIKDINHGIISIYDKNNFYLATIDDVNINDILLSDDEKEIENLWKSFYKIIGINERKNDRCRMNFMPKKYWKYILEVSDEL